jgi:general nucleoside transport system permease protein
MHEGLLVTSIATALLSGTPVLIAATGELMVEKLGMFDIGIEGIMLIGALAGFLADRATGSWVAALAVAALAGSVTGFLYGLGVVVLRADMIIASLALVLLGEGITGQAGASHVLQHASAPIPVWNIPGLSSIRYVGTALFKQPVTTYLAFLCALAVGFLLTRTRHGLTLRAVGENPAAADAAGIHVVGLRLLYLAIGGAFAGIGGAVLVLANVGTWNTDVTAGEGFIAFAVVFFSGWRAGWVIVGAYLFGALTTLGNVGQAEGWKVPSEFFTALPYIGTVVVMIIRAWVRRARGGGLGWPASLGIPFYRG